jgi:peroxiredoxin
MAQLRQDYQKFIERDAEIIVIGPESETAFARYWHKENLPFVGLPDPAHTVSNLYGQQVKLLKLGRLPAFIIIDKNGQIRFAHYGNSMSDIPGNGEILTMLDHLNQSS